MNEKTELSANLFSSTYEFLNQPVNDFVPVIAFLLAFIVHRLIINFSRYRNGQMDSERQTNQVIRYFNDSINIAFSNKLRND